MERTAPNVCAIVGPKLTAQLLGLTGGLEELSKIPACNLQVIGQIRQTSASRGGMSSIHTRPNEGILRECALVQQCAKNFQTKAIKTVAAKVALAARCDFVNVSAGRARDNSAGQAFYREIEGRLKKFGESDKAPVLKSLPK
jgi:U4/U6 small nuclear ribonucleoprotein PRP31